jgi:hypothetical protein
MTVTYCTANDVASNLRLMTYDSTTDKNIRMVFSESTEPTLAEVEAWINQAEDTIDTECNRAWREIATTEVHNVPYSYKNTGGRMTFSVNHIDCKAFDADEGDKLEVETSTGWEDVSDRTDWWFDATTGMVTVRDVTYLATHYNPGRVTRQDRRYRFTYRYGVSVVPGDIKEACIKLVSLRLMESDYYRKVLPEGLNGSSQSSVMNRYDERIARIIEKNRNNMAVMY